MIDICNTERPISSDDQHDRYIRIRQEALRKLSRGKVDTKVKQILAHFGRCALPATTVKQTLAKFR